MQACINCRLDYCNSLLCGIATTVRPECGRTSHHWQATDRAHHTSLQSPHLLPVQQRTVQVGDSSPQVSLDYLADDCRWTRHRRPDLRSSTSMMKLEVPSTRTTFGDRSFAVDGPRVWNSLPASIRDPIGLHYHLGLLYFIIVLRLNPSFNSCGVCDSEQKPI